MIDSRSIVREDRTRRSRRLVQLPRALVFVIGCIATAVAVAQVTAREWANDGQLKLQRGDLDGAIAAFNRAAVLEPNLADIFLFRGNAKQFKGDLNGAIADFTQAGELAPTYADAFYNRGNAGGQG